MDVKKRYLSKFIEEDLKEKMVFLGGARQVGKTTIAKEIISKDFKSSYYNWDKMESRRSALKGEWPSDKELIILDEFHKYKKWKTWIKGEYDTYKDKYHFLLTGSAHLNIYRRGGDSLQGRYHYYTLHPFTIAEIKKLTPEIKIGNEIKFIKKIKQDDLETILQFGGFPEPLFKQDSRFLRRWHNERLERFFAEDIRDLTMIKDFGNLTLLADLLPEKVSSILSINSLAQDLQVNFRTISNWIDVFEQFYYCFRIPPFQSRKIASVRKEKKLYLWDWSQIQDEGARLENCVASHLLKFCNWLYEYEGHKASLSFLRDTTGKEVDFIVTIDNIPWFAVEVKNSDADVAKNLIYFKEKLSIPQTFQVVKKCNKERMQGGVLIINAATFLASFI